MAKSNVVILGGGAAGANIFTGLTKKIDRSRYNLVLLNNRDFSVWLPALLRLAVFDEASIEEGAFVPLDHLTANDTLKVGTVVSIEEGAQGQGGYLVLESGEKFPYAVLVLAPGSLWEGPLNLPNDRDQVREHLKRWRRKFASAKEIVIAGGGAVGFELAGELKDLSSNKKVTIVHGASSALNDAYPEKFRRALSKQFAARGVNIVYNDYIDTFPEQGVVGVTTRNGKHFNADLVVPTRGGKPNTQIVGSLGAGVLTASGHIKTDATLQVKGHPSIFAAGDVLDWSEQKQAGKTKAHADVVVDNVLARLAQQAPQKQYKGFMEAIIVTDGKGGGVSFIGALWGVLLGSWFTRMVKSKTLLVSMHKGLLKY